MYIFVTLKD